MTKQLICTTVIACMLVGLIPQPTEAQLVVEDPAAIAQLILSVSHLTEMVGLELKDLAALHDLAAVAQIGAQALASADKLRSIYGTLQARMNGWGSHMANVPCRQEDWGNWEFTAAEWWRQGTSDFRLAISLLGDSAQLMALITQIISSIGILFGTTSGLQVVSSLTAVNTLLLQNHQTLAGSFKQVQMGGYQIEQMRMLSNDCIRRARYRNWGRFTRY
jgi:hypothetical protein